MHTIVLQHSDYTQEIAKAVDVLRAGGLILFPTETTYGAGVDALNPAAVQKLLAYKSRREGKPLSIAVTSQEMAEQYVELNESAKALYKRFLPGPVTVISKGKHTVAPGVESEFGTLGIRIPKYQLVLDLLKAFGRPITATSANGSGEKRPYSIQDVMDGLSEKQKSLIDLVVDAGELEHNPPSTVIDTTLSAPVIFRQGDVQATEHNQNSSSLELISSSEDETKDIAKRLLLKNWSYVSTTGLIIGLNGSLGMGKTIFVKGAAEFLQITDTITSPTYSYVEEYDFNRHGALGKLFHLDVWKIESEQELERLAFESMLRPQTVVIVEWVSTIAPFLPSLLSKHPLKYVEVSFREEDGKRYLSIRE